MQRFEHADRTRRSHAGTIRRVPALEDCPQRDAGIAGCRKGESGAQSVDNGGDKPAKRHGRLCYRQRFVTKVVDIGSICHLHKEGSE